MFSQYWLPALAVTFEQILPGWLDAYAEPAPCVSAAMQAVTSRA
jgi:hypothetical protein